MLFLKYFNLCEGIFWFIYAYCCLAIPFFPNDESRVRRVQVAVIFVLLGFSDFVEMQTGAWWRPWWLLLWKGTCVIFFLYLYRFYKRVGLKQGGVYGLQK